MDNRKSLFIKAEKAIKSFAVVGVNETEPTHYYSTKEKYIERIDIIKTKVDTDKTKIHVSDLEKWYRISHTIQGLWMRIFYTYTYSRTKTPITSIKLIECDHLNSEYIVIDYFILAS